MRRLSLTTTLAMCALALGLALAGCSSSKSGSGSTTTTSAAGSTVTTAPSSGAAAVTIQNLTFSVKSVKAGATVTVQNQDSFGHTVSADDGSFDVSVDGGGTATFVAPSKAGTYAFHCNIHSSMHGTLTVT